MDKDLIESGVKLTMGIYIGQWVARQSLALFGKLCGRFISLELKDFKNELRTEILEEVKKILNDRNAK